jgi:hypothetical protein
MGQMRNVYKALVKKPEGNRLLERPKCRWKENIKMDFEVIWWEGVH